VFEKGKSGNPKGRPKSDKTIIELARTMTEDALNTLYSVMMESDKDQARVAAASAILDRGWGKPPQALEHTGKDGGPIETKTVEFVDGPKRESMDEWLARHKDKQTNGH
jgi:hypothetical protein